MSECANCRVKRELDMLKEKFSADYSITVELLAENNELKELVYKLLELSSCKKDSKELYIDDNVPSISQLIKSESQMSSGDVIESKLHKIAREIVREIRSGL